MSRWTHSVAEQDDDHAADQHYTATGKWVCYRCGETVLLDGRKVPITADPPFRAAHPLVEPPLSSQP